MNYYVWPANLIEEADIFGPLSVISGKTGTVVSVTEERPEDSSENIVEKKSRTKFLYLDDGCVYETTFRNHQKNGSKEHPLAEAASQRQDDAQNAAAAADSPTSLVYTPLAKFRVLSIHCGYGVYGAITATHHAYVWGKSEKGQCGVLAPYVEKPQRVSGLLV